jgi:hypothetical protein
LLQAETEASRIAAAAREVLLCMVGLSFRDGDP